MTAPGSLTAVVLDWNLPAYTIRCVGSLVGDGLDPGRVVVVQNGPTEESWETVRRELARCVLVRIDRNIGFARANNVAVGALPGSAYLFCNNDAFVHRPGSVSALAAALERESVGIAVPRLLNEDGSLQPSVVPFTTPGPAAVRASGLSRFVPNRWQPRWSTHWDHGASRDVDAALGAVIAVRGEVWEQLGGFRETSFMYAEDIDLSWRASRLGWKTRFVAESEFLHLGGTSSSVRWTDAQRAERIGWAEAAVIRENLSPRRADASIALMRLGLAARVAAFGLLGRKDAAESCRGSLRGLRPGARPEVEVATGAPPEVEVVRPAS